MESLEVQILQYAELSGEQQLAVDEAVKASPEYKPLLHAVKLVEALGRGSNVLVHVPPTDEALAYFETTRGLTHDPPDAVAEAFSLIEKSICDYPDLRRRYDEVARRIRELEAESDAAAQFERLSGMSLDPRTHHRRDRDSHAGRTGDNRIREPSETAPRRSRRSWRARDLVSLTAVCALTAYSTIFWYSDQVTADHTRLAKLTRSEMTTLLLRSEEASERGMEFHELLMLRGAVQGLREARRSKAGLFPTYDTENLREAMLALDQVANLENASPFLKEETAYFQAKAYLALDDFAGARQKLEVVLNGSGPKQTAAVALLRRLRQLER